MLSKGLDEADLQLVLPEATSDSLPELTAVMKNSFEGFKLDFQTQNRLWGFVLFSGVLVFFAGGLYFFTFDSRNQGHVSR